MVDEISTKAAVGDLFLTQVAGQLVDDGADHLKMPQFLGAYIGQKCLKLWVRHGVPLAEIAQGSTEFPVWTTVLTDNIRGKAGIGGGNFYRVLQLLFIHEHKLFSPFHLPGPGGLRPGIGAVVCHVGMSNGTVGSRKLLMGRFVHSVILLEQFESLGVVRVSIQIQAKLQQDEFQRLELGHRGTHYIPGIHLIPEGEIKAGEKSAVIEGVCL
ncbi:hypothetical protein SDC9_58093 [bioreactor metagenome]|uniref:Uncharacterized protein n=1 Tax=bioreactor metagenome TaxID=1076179 RepID=A0A644X6G7_9ZZZZ